jgi:hypothetical protein
MEAGVNGEHKNLTGSKARRLSKPLSIGLVATALAAIPGCAALVAPLAVKFGADLIASASTNYSQNYANKVQNLLQGVYSKAVARYQQPAPDAYASQGGYPPAGSSDPYGSQSPQGGTTYAGATSSYPSSQSDPYGSAAGAQGAQSSPYPAGNAYPSAPSAYGSASPIVLDATILAQRASDRAARRTEPKPIQDGETLRDGGADPRKGDVTKFSFRANCDCFVYVIGADATGYIARIFPDPASGLSNPVQANRQYVVPEGTAWYGLDQYKGVEQVFFIVSRTPRQDIEGPLSQLAQTPRTAPPQNYRSVREVATSDASRGLVKVQMGAQSTVQGESGQRYNFTPQSFAAQSGTDDVVITRWFNHQ